MSQADSKNTTIPRAQQLSFNFANPVVADAFRRAERGDRHSGPVLAVLAPPIQWTPGAAVATPTEARERIALELAL